MKPPRRVKMPSIKSSRPANAKTTDELLKKKAGRKKKKKANGY